MTVQEWCERFKALDTQFGTDNRSSLHHDNRCANHNRPLHSSYGEKKS